MDPEKSVQQASAAQRALLEMYQEGSRFWLDRVQSEMALGRIWDRSCQKPAQSRKPLRLTANVFRNR
jgi:hypothetical protein